MPDSVSKTGTVIGFAALIVFAACYLGIIVLAVIFGFAEGDVPWFVKIMLGSLLVGIGILLLVVVRERLIERKTDKYKDVEI